MTALTINKNPKNPYKGLHPYEEKDKKRFYGRETEKKKLLRLVKHNYVTVVFGKSGIGKTSLLNAGLSPQLKNEGFWPIQLGLDYGKPGLLKQAKKIIISEFEDSEILKKDDAFKVKEFRPDETLWEYFHRVKNFDNKKGKGLTPVLVLDQFEEMFTIGKNHEELNDWINELFYLIEDEFPEALRNKILKDELKGEEEFPYTSDPPNLKIIIVLREDYLSHLNALKDRIHSIDRVRFQVKPLDGQQAKDIIQKPGRIKDKKVINHILRLSYLDDVREDKEIQDEKLEVEPWLLSLICYQIIKEKKVKSFTKEDRHRILTRFYDSVMKGFPEEVENFIELKLLTDGGFRTPYYLSPKQPLRKCINQLVKLRILRKSHDGNKSNIEIIHDVLVPIIREKRNKRLQKIKNEELKKEFNRRLIQKRKNVIIAVLSGLALVFIALGVYAFYQKIRANKQYMNAQVNRLTAEALVESFKDNTRAIRIAEAAFEMGLPNPPARTYQILSDIGYSSFEEPFYITAVHHKGTIYKAVFAPDGNRFLTASEDGTARLWDMEGNCLLDFKHNARVFSAVFSPDGKQILTASWDGTARLWDIGGKLLKNLKHNGTVFSAVFSSDGQRILTASKDGFAKVWDMEGKPILNFKHNKAVSSAVFSRDGNRILTTCWDNVVRTWNIKGTVISTFEPETAVSSAVFFPDGNRILAVVEDDTAKVFSQEGKPIVVLKHDKKILSAEFSPDGNRIITALENGTAKLWDVEGNFISNKKMHGKTLSSAVFSPDGSMLLTASRDGTAKVWSMRDKLLVADLIKYKGQLSSAVFSPDGKKIFTASEDGSAKEWDKEGKQIEKNFRHEGAVFFAAYSPDGSRILTVSEGGTAKTWNREGEVIADLKQIGYITSAVFLADGQRILTAFGTNSLKVLDIEGNLLSSLELDEIASFAMFSPDGQHILTTSADKSAKLWSLNGRFLKNFDHSEIVSCTSFSPNSKLVTTASINGTAKLWDLQGNLLAKLDEHTAGINSTVFSPDGLRILTASKDGTVKLWDLEGNLLANLNKRMGEVKTAVFSPDGQRILTASHDGTVKLWHTPEAIYHWLKTAKVQKLPGEERQRLGIK